MTKKSILASIVLIFVGIVFGVVLVSNFHEGIRLGFAGDPQVKLGAPSPIKNSDYDYKSLSKPFIEVSKAVTPTVVSITVTTKPQSTGNDLNEFFHFFGPDGKSPQAEPEQAGGSGVIISPEGYILTNNHVVQDAEEKGIKVLLKDKHEYDAKLIGTDPTTDLAVIKVDGKDLPTAAFGNSDNLQIGEWVLAIGNPLGLQSTVTAGIVSATGRQIGILRDEQQYGIEDFIQTDAAINPGNSGGPLVNLNGEVIGINSAIATTNARYQGYGFAIPINLARSVAEDIIRNGKVRRGYIGVRIGSVNDAFAKALGLPRTEGVLVQSLEPGGSAEAAGIHEKDVILSVDGKDVNEANDLQMYIARKHPGDQVSLKIFRDGSVIDKTVTLHARKEEAVTASNDSGSNDEDRDAEREAPSRTVTFSKLGLSVRALTSDDKKTAGVSNGVVVNDVTRFGEAFNQGVTTGDIILEADNTKLHNPSDLKSIVDKHKSGDAILLRVKRGGTMAYFALQMPG
ncbi:MAG TPA: Do family serine endopeptidase [Bacteroidota bacterium]|nr:Do family serine endopeptidase [Bacteroidota bacterium]